MRFRTAFHAITARSALTAAGLATTALTTLAPFGVAHAATAAATPLVTGAISDATTTALTASVPAALASATDTGALASTASFPHLQLALQRPAARQAALDALVAAQTDPASPQYHQWLTPAQLRSDYGPAQSDIDAVTGWLTAHGLTVNKVSATGMSIDFSGTAASLKAAFHAAMHGFARNGESHLASATVPTIPAALSPVVAGVTLSNFFPHPVLKKAQAPLASVASQVASGQVRKIGTSLTDTVDGTTFYAVTPADFATIYNVNQARNGYAGAALTGAGVTLVVAEQTDINPADWNTFRSLSGLSSYPGTLSITHPGGCADPGFTVADETEAAIDSEWSSAVAPGANIIEAACAGTATTFGVMTTLQNLVELGTPAVAISISYGGSEQGNGLAFLQMWENLVEEGASEGISIFVSAGDGASDIGDTGATVATTGLSVNGLASNPYDTAIGGTDFGDTAKNENAVYWSSTNSATGGSALSYVPEIPWDNSCTNSINYKYVGATGPILNCNNPPAGVNYQNVVGGSGGRSLIYAKPDWQTTSLAGVPNDGVRDLPDVSLFAANGFWNHFYLECQSNTATGGAPCDPYNSTDFLDSAYGGTSFGAPDFAGIAALVAQFKGYRVGNMAPRLYQLAALQYASTTLAKQCLASKGNAVSAACVFYDVNTGDNSVACQAGTPDCYTNANSTQGIGVLTSVAGKNDPAFPAGVGYDLATGLGTVNVTNLIVNY